MNKAELTGKIIDRKFLHEIAVMLDIDWKRYDTVNGVRVAVITKIHRLTKGVEK